MRGYTLVEVAMASGLLALAVLIASTILLQANRTALWFEAYSAESMERLTAEGQLRSVFADAVDIRSIGAASLNQWSNPASFTGALREFDSDPEFKQSPSVRTLAVFWRESRLSATSSAGMVGMSSQFQKTALFFQKPTPQTHGAIYVDFGSGAVLAPRRSDFMIEGLTRVRIHHVTTHGSFPGPVTSFDLEMTFRRFLSSPEQGTFCPAAFVDQSADCRAHAPFRDVTRTLRLVLRNNLLEASPSGQQGARLYDRIHFFKPFVSGGLL